MPAVFISHSSLDKRWAAEVKASLDRLGLENVFLDFDKVSGIGVGEHWEKRLYEEISRCHAVVIVLTASWLASKWCFVELAQARALGKVIIPLAVEPLGSAVLPELQALAVDEWTDEGRERLERRLRAISDELARGFRFDPKRAPFPGINSFESEDAATFFGRDDETRTVIELLDARRAQGGRQLLLLMGPSGSGKSSLLKAGVLPQIGRRDKEWLLLPPIRPGKAPVEALAKAVAHHLGQPLEWGTWFDTLCSDDATRKLSELLRELQTGEARLGSFLLAIDQFEEIYTLADARQRAKFVQILASALGPANDLPLMVLAAGRSDVLTSLIEGGELASVTATFLLEPLPLERIARLLEGPAAVAGLLVEDGLAEQVARDVENPEALPLLAHALALLYQRSAHDKHLTLDRYRAIGDAESGLNPIQNSIRMSADRALSGHAPSDEEYDALREAFVPHLVRVTSEGTKRVRNPAYRSQLPERSQRLVSALVEARLLSTRSSEKSGDNASANGEIVVEVTHEALFKAWPLLDKWLTQEHAFLVDVERIDDAYDLWTQVPEQQKSAALLRGWLLSRARDWLDKYPMRFAASDMRPIREFIGASVQADEAERIRAAEQVARTAQIKRRFFIGAICAAVVFLCIAIFAGLQYAVADNERKIAVAREIFAHAQVQEGMNDECSLLAYVAALDAARQAEDIDLRPFEDGVRAALPQTHVVATAQASLLAREVSWNSDGTQLAFVDAQNKVQLWTTTDGGIKPPSKESVGGLHAEWLPSGNRLAVVQEKEISILDADGATVVQALPMPKLDLQGLRFDHAGRRALAWSIAQSRSFLIDFESGKLQAFRLRTRTWRGHAWSHDDKRVALATDSSIWLIELGESNVEQIEQQEVIASLAWSRDGKYLAVGNDNGRIRIWDVGLKRFVHTLDGHSNQVMSLDFSPDGKLLASGSWDHSVGIWDTRTWRLQRKLTAGNGGIVVVRWNPAKPLLATADQDGIVRLWSPLTSRASDVVWQTTGWVWSASWNKDGSMIAVSSDSEIVFRNETGLIHRLDQPIGQYRGGVWSANDSTYAVVDDEKVMVHDVAKKQEVMARRVELGSAPLFAVALSPKGDVVAAASTEGVRVFSVPDGKLKWQVDAGSTSLAFSPDGALLALVPTTGTAVEILDIVAGKHRTSLPGLKPGKATWALQWSPDGGRIAAASDDRIARVWNVSSGKLVHELRGHAADVKGVAWSHSGDRLATASLDKTVRLWDLSTGRAIATLADHASGVRSVAWSSDDKSIITGGEDGSSRLFLTDFSRTLEVARAQTKIGMTADETQRCTSGFATRALAAKTK